MTLKWAGVRLGRPRRRMQTRKCQLVHAAPERPDPGARCRRKQRSPCPLRPRPRARRPATLWLARTGRLGDEVSGPRAGRPARPTFPGSPDPLPTEDSKSGLPSGMGAQAGPVATRQPRGAGRRRAAPGPAGAAGGLRPRGPRTHLRAIR